MSALRLTLPYHDARRPPELNRADYIVSANVGRTVQACRQAVMDARRAIGWLASQGYDRIGILGTSLGSCLSLLTAAHEPRVRAQALNHISPYFADVVWRGLSTTHVREGLEGAVELERLREMWLPISPHVYLDRIQNTKTLLVYAKYDLTFPVDLSRDARRRVQPAEDSARADGVAVRALLDRPHSIQISRRLRPGEVSGEKSVKRFSLPRQRARRRAGRRGMAEPGAAAFAPGLLDHTRDVEHRRGYR